MLLQPIGFEIPIWVIYYVLATLGGPTLLPIIAGVVCGRFMEWISPSFGLTVGIGVTVVGATPYIAFVFVLRENFFPKLDLTAAQFFGSLVALIVIQVLLVVELCLLVNWRRDRTWGIRGWWR